MDSESLPNQVILQKTMSRITASFPFVSHRWDPGPGPSLAVSVFQCATPPSRKVFSADVFLPQRKALMYGGDIRHSTVLEKGSWRHALASELLLTTFTSFSKRTALRRRCERTCPAIGKCLAKQVGNRSGVRKFGVLAFGVPGFRVSGLRLLVS